MVGAAIDCATNKTKCIDDATKAGAHLDNATKYITAAVADCGGTASAACKQSIRGLVFDIGNASTAIVSLCDDCEASPGFKCTLDAIHAAAAITTSAMAIAKTADVCGSGGPGQITGGRMDRYS